MDRLGGAVRQVPSTHLPRSLENPPSHLDILSGEDRTVKLRDDPYAATRAMEDSTGHLIRLEEALIGAGYEVYADTFAPEKFLGAHGRWVFFLMVGHLRIDVSENPAGSGQWYYVVNGVRSGSVADVDRALEQVRLRY